jgi:GPH family glycoside/pentoside/hexuronide:cation symporter
MAHPSQRIPTGEKLAFGIGEFGNDLYWQFFSSFLLFFYTDIFKIAPGAQAAAVAGVMFMIVRLWDGMFDVIVGVIADRTNSRWGKFRPYLLFGAVPFGVAGVVAFTTPDLGPAGKIVYAYVTYTILMMVYSAVAIPQNSLLGVMSGDSLERTSLSKYKFTFAFLASAVVQYATFPLAAHFGRGNQAVGFQRTLLCYAICAVVFFVFSFAFIKERVSPPPDQKPRLGDDFRDLLGNTPWIVLCITTLASILSIATRSQTNIYYFKYYVKGWDLDTVFWGVHHIGYQALFGDFLVLGTVMTILGTWMVPYFSRLVGKRALYCILIGSAGVFTLGFYFIPPDRVGLIFLLQVLVSITLGPTSAVLWAMYADCADFSEWVNRRRATALVFSAAIFCQKLGWSFGGLVPGWLLTKFGYVADTDLSPRTLHGILVINCVIPAAFALLAAALVLFYGLNETKLKTIETDLQARRSAAAG